MQWLAAPLNYVDSTIDRLTTPRPARGNDSAAAAGQDTSKDGGGRRLVLDDDARAALADEGFGADVPLPRSGNGNFGAPLEVGPIAALDDAGAGGGDGDGDDHASVHDQRTIDIRDAAMGAAVSPLRHDEEEEQEGSFVNDVGTARAVVGRAPLPLPLHPDTKSRPIGGAGGGAGGGGESGTSMDEGHQYVLETPPARPWPPLKPRPQQQQPPNMSANASSSRGGSTKPPPSQTKRGSAAATAPGNAGASPFPGRLLKRARPPSPAGLAAEGYLGGFLANGGGDDVVGNGSTGNAAVHAPTDEYDSASSLALVQEEERIRRVRDEAAARLEAERVRADAERQRAREEEAERQRIAAAAKEQARIEEEAKRMAAAKAAEAQQREAMLEAEMERRAREEEEARRVAAWRKVQEEQQHRQEAARRIVAAREEARRRALAEEEEAKRALEAEAERQAQEEVERRRIIAEEQARVVAQREEARAAAEAKAEAERRLREEEAAALHKNETSRDEDLDSEYEDYEVHLPLQPWDAPPLKIGKDVHDGGAAAEISSFSSPLPAWHSAMNRRGVVQIRLYRAQRLSCTAGRSLRAHITLPPWKGKVTTEWTKAYVGPEGFGPDEDDDHSIEDVGAGVCARWDDEDTADLRNQGNGDGFDEVSSDAQNAVVTTYNMVHHYNDVDTPVPDISIELTTASMLGFESIMSVVVPLSVNVLMREPGIWRRRWCPASAPGKDGAASQPSSPRRAVSGAVRGNGESPQTFARRKIAANAFNSYGTSEALGPLFLLEARFVPTSLNGDIGGGKEEEDASFASAQGHIEERGTPSTQDASTSLQPESGSVPSSKQVASYEDNELSRIVPASYEVPLESPLTITSVTAAPDMKPSRPSLDAFMHAERYNKQPDSDVQSVQSVTSALTGSTATLSQRRILQAKPHHLRVLPSWTSPNRCSICSALVVPFRATCYQCETCNIICCTDCQLRVDVRLPCGSDEAKKAAEKAKRSTFSGALGELMSVVAPIEEKADERDGEPTLSVEDIDRSRSIGVSSSIIDGVASLRIKIVRACLFDRPYAPETDLDYILKKEGRALRVGDHYARITWTGSGAASKRTRTVFQTARPLFDSELMVFDIPHYGTEYRVEVIDANTEEVVGTALFPAQSILQWQRDEMSTSSSLPLRTVLDIRAQREMHKKKVIELRKGVKSGFGLDYFNTAKKKDDASKPDTSDEGRAGEISGWMECDIELLENTKGLICGNEIRGIAPNTTPDDFRIDLVQLHIARIKALIADIKKLIGAYLYIVSWEDPILTALSLIVFVRMCLRFNMEYIGSLPPSMMALYMAYLWKTRRAGQFAFRWVKTERDARVKAERKLTINHSTHRPMGFLDVSVIRGKNLRSYELGLPGAAYASVFWDALHFAPETEREMMAEIDPAAKGSHEVGSTVAAGITSHPEWKAVVESAESERLKQLIPAEEDAVDESPDLGDSAANDPSSLQFPILQPIALDSSTSDKDGRRNIGNDIHLVPWELSPGAIVIQICFQDALNKFALIDPFFGDVIIPLKRLAKKKEIEGWFPVNDIGGNANGLHQVSSSGTLLGGGGNKATPVKGKGHGDEPQVYLKLKLALPGASPWAINDASDAEKEASMIVAEEMMRSGAMSEGENIGLIGTGLNTFNTVRGLNSQLQGIQNTLGGVLDTIERLRNVFNFASPNRSSIIVVCLLALWLILAIIPTRAILLICGLAQYAATFYSAFGKRFRTKKGVARPAPLSRRSSSAEANADAGVATRITNFLAGLPTDEDLRRAYFWEARREGEKAREELALKKRMLRLNRLWRAQWFGTVELKEMTSSKEADRQWDWEPVFALVHGHRFIWWRSEKHFDDGEPPLGQIFFAGHSGLGGLSPMEMRELSREEALLIVTMFGRGFDEQQKISLLCPNEKAKEALEDAVIGASMGSKVD